MHYGNLRQLFNALLLQVGQVSSSWKCHGDGGGHMLIGGAGVGDRLFRSQGSMASLFRGLNVRSQPVKSHSYTVWPAKIASSSRRWTSDLYGSMTPLLRCRHVGYQNCWSYVRSSKLQKAACHTQSKLFLRKQNLFEREGEDCTSSPTRIWLQKRSIRLFQGIDLCSIPWAWGSSKAR